MDTSLNETDKVSGSGQKAIIALFLLFMTTCSFSQLSYELSGIAGRSKYSEELYVRTDRDIYIAGEEVFLKIFCSGSLTRNKSEISSVAYVSLLDSHNNPVLQVKVRIAGSSGSGYFVLPDSLSTGNYNISSCTHWMRNFSPALFSYKNITVINPFGNIDNIKIPPGKPEADTVIFYPESGNIIAGAKNLIGFRSFGANMTPVEITGVITDSSNNILCHVQSDENGYGLFRLIPPSNGRLYLKTTEAKMASGQFVLPRANSSAIALSVSKEGEKGIFRVRLSKSDDFNINTSNCHLIYSPLSLPPFFLDTDLFLKGEISLRQNSLPSGLAAIMVADNTGHRYAERWVYNDPKQVFNITVRADKQYYSPREKVKIDLFTADTGGKPVESDLLLSAVRLGALRETGNDSGCDLQISGLPAGNIKHRSSGITDRLIFYQTNDDLKDLFTGGQAPVFLPEPDGQIISGSIRNRVSGEPLRHENIVLSFVGKTALCKFTKTDEDGRFMFVSLEEGVREIVIQPLSPDQDDYYVELDDPFPETFSNSANQAFSIDTGMLEMINRSVISMQVKRIYDPFLQVKPDTLKNILINDFYGMPEFTTRMSDFIQLSSLRETIKEILPGVVTSRRNGKTVINTIFRNNYQIETRDPLVLVDGVPVFNHEKVLNIPGDKIEKIDVLNMKYYISDISFDGIIDITTNKGDLSLIDFDKPVFRQEFDALRSGPGFSSPDYSDNAHKMSRIPDFRNTLYWDPDLRTEVNGRTEAEFYTSDEPGEYVILVEGFTSDGHRGCTTYHFSVRK